VSATEPGNAWILAANRASQVLLVALDDAGYTVASLGLYEGRCAIWLDHAKARAAATALGLRVRTTRDLWSGDFVVTLADCTHVQGEDTVRVVVFGDHDPQPGGDPPVSEWSRPLSVPSVVFTV
jgi:hypothetical protein